jgi:hypothetical protein
MPNRSPALDALLHPLNLATLGLAVAFGLCGAWWLFPLGLLVWLAMVISIARDPGRRINYQLQARAAALSPRFQQLYDKIVRSQVRMFNTLNSSDGRTRRALEPLHAEVEALTDQVYTLCQRMTGPENYMKVTQANTDLDGERALLVLGMDGIADPLVKREKEEALKTLDNRIQQVKQVKQLLDRVDAQMGSVVNAMDAALADVIRLQAVGAAQAEKQVAPLLQQIRDQMTQLKAFEAEAAQVA